MNRGKPPGLVKIMWWSVRLGWSRQKPVRRQLREAICWGLGEHWQRFAPGSAPGTDSGIVRAVWLGAALASRSRSCYPLLSEHARLIWVSRVLGRTTGKSILAAYLAWTWLKKAALGSLSLDERERTSS